LNCKENIDMTDNGQKTNNRIIMIFYRIGREK